jgi:hypothetical protein
MTGFRFCSLKERKQMQWSKQLIRPLSGLGITCLQRIVATTWTWKPDPQMIIMLVPLMIIQLILPQIYSGIYSLVSTCANSWG